MTDPRSLLDILKPILDEYLVQRSDLERRITQQGTIPSHFCERCHRHSILGVQRLFAVSSREVADLMDWINTNNLNELSSDGKEIRFSSPFEKVEGTRGTQIGPASPIIKPSRYYYAIPVSKLGKRLFHTILLNEFDRLETCGHLEQDGLRESLPAIVTRLPRFIGFRSDINGALGRRRERALRFLCPECYSRIDSMGCDDGMVKRDGFVFDYSWCPIDLMLLQDLFEKTKIRYKVPKVEDRFTPRAVDIYLDDLKVLITNGRHLEDHVEKLKPECVLVFGGKGDIFDYLRLGTHLIIFDDSATASQRYFVFDKDKKVEESLERIVEDVVSKLDMYTEEIRGKEHDRLVGAFQRIGRDLGFITQQELPIKGTRVDVAWLDRQGNVKIAIEVETSSTWKKDIVSTWEAQPHLAIILIHDKTNKGIKEMAQYALLKTMPHKLLLVNYQLKKAYLVDKQDIVKCFDLEKKTEQTKTDVVEF